MLRAGGQGRGWRRASPSRFGRTIFRLHGFMHKTRGSLLMAGSVASIILGAESSPAAPLTRAASDGSCAARRGTLHTGCQSGRQALQEFITRWPSRTKSGSVRRRHCSTRQLSRRGARRSAGLRRRNRPRSAPRRRTTRHGLAAESPPRGLPLLQGYLPVPVCKFGTLITRDGNFSTLSDDRSPGSIHVTHGLSRLSRDKSGLLRFGRSLSLL